MPDRRNRRSLLRPAVLGLEFAAVLIGATLVGVWVDRHYATTPWGAVVGSSVGLVGGFYKFLRSSIAAFRASREAPVDEGREER